MTAPAPGPAGGPARAARPAPAPAPAPGPARAPGAGGRPVLALVVSRRRRFTRHVLDRPDIDTVLLRPEGSPVGAPGDRPVFVLRDAAPPDREAARFRAWCAALGRRPRYFCNPDEAAQPSMHRFAAAAGLPHLSPEQVRRATDKTAMKELFADAGLPAARFRVVTSAAEVKDFAGGHGWPVVVKPALSGSSVDTWKAGPDDLAAIDRALAAPPERTWIVEEYVRGTEHQLCALVHGGEVLDAFIAVNPAPLLDALSGAMNADITLAPSEPEPVDGREVARRVVDALGYRDGYLHAEFFLRPDGSFVMGEVAARLGGAELPVSHGLSRGFDMLAAVADVYVGRRPPLEYTRSRSVGELLLPARRGVVTEITPLEELLAMPGVLSGELTASVGDRLDPPRASSACAGHVHIEGENSGVVLNRMREVLSSFTLEVSEAAP
ncbi:ATP-dependent carboxylate-amine ligase [Streptomyces sp. NPDC016309]|uniref:ATP-grasp domain-containing protein n=1 Tax=Streptomyces sp. NPDC016309 TaxID=3364965 RepID=UPI0036FB8549